MRHLLAIGISPRLVSNQSLGKGSQEIGIRHFAHLFIFLVPSDLCVFHMPTKFNPQFGEIAADLGDQGRELLRPWQGDCWRFQAISHPRGRDILSGKGALQNGGRWNAPGTFPVVLHDAAAIGVMLGGLRE